MVTIPPDQLEQLLRLHAFREQHPEVIIGAISRRAWQACIPEPDDGHTVITRGTLASLLDRACELLGDLDHATAAITAGPATDCGHCGPMSPRPAGPGGTGKQGSAHHQRH
jgi:hypothetical protein